MKELKILYLYPDMLELYGDYGNIQILQYRMKKRDINCIVDRYSIGDKKPNFFEYDIIFAGGGADNEQNILAKDLMQYKDDLKLAVQQGIFFLLICGGYQLFGKYYKDVDGNVIPGLEIFPYYTEAILDRKKRCIGNIILEVELQKGQPTKVMGFENHGGQTFNSISSFGKVLLGNGNSFKGDKEGFFMGNVIATYLHGPLLAKNPQISDYIIKYCLQRKYNEDIILNPLDDTFEIKCREQLLNRFLEK